MFLKDKNMNKIYAFHVFLLSIALVVSGCSVIYDFTQASSKSDCYALPKSLKEECEQRTITYEEYEKARKDHGS